MVTPELVEAGATLMLLIAFTCGWLVVRGHR